MNFRNTSPRHVAFDTRPKGFTRALFQRVGISHIFNRKRSRSYSPSRPPTPYYWEENDSNIGGSSISLARSATSTPAIAPTGQTSTQTTPPASPNLLLAISAGDSECLPADQITAMPAPFNPRHHVTHWHETDLNRLSLRFGEAFHVAQDFPTDVDSNNVNEVPFLNSMVRAALEAPDDLPEDVDTRFPYVDTPENAPSEICSALGRLYFPNFEDNDNESEIVAGPSDLASGNGSKYPPGIEEILTTPDNQLQSWANRRTLERVLRAPRTGSVTSRFHEHTSMSESSPAVMFDLTVFERPAIEIIIPPCSPRSVSPIHQQPGNWNLRGARAAVGYWERFYTHHGKQYRSGLLVYFKAWWLPKSCKKYLKASYKLTQTLQLLLNDLTEFDNLSPRLAKVIEKMDMDLRTCKEDSDMIYAAANRESASLQGPIIGKALVWRRNSIADQPCLIRATKNLNTVRTDLEQLRKSLQDVIEAGCDDLVAFRKGFM